MDFRVHMIHMKFHQTSHTSGALRRLDKPLLIIPGRSVSSSVQWTTGVSLGKRINTHTQLLTQMEQWHTLLEKGGIN